MKKITNSEATSEFLKLIGYEKIDAVRKIILWLFGHLIEKIPSAIKFRKVTYTHNTFYNNLYWFCINISLLAANMTNKKGIILVWFYFSNQQRLIANDENYMTESGNVVASVEFLPTQFAEEYDSLSVWIPYGSLNLSPGFYNLCFDIGVYDESDNLIAKSNYYYFDLQLN